MLSRARTVGMGSGCEISSASPSLQLAMIPPWGASSASGLSCECVSSEPLPWPKNPDAGRYIFMMSAVSKSTARVKMHGWGGHHRENVISAPSPGNLTRHRRKLRLPIGGARLRQRMNHTYNLKHHAMNHETKEKMGLTQLGCRQCVGTRRSAPQSTTNL